jgi:CBS domain-containing protein
VPWPGQRATVGDMNGKPAESLISAAVAFLERYPPFDAMEREVLRFAAECLSLGYYPKDSVILAPAAGEPQVFYIIQRGLVRLAQAPGFHVSGGAVLTLGPGECFSVGALLEKRAVGSAYVAAADTFCYQLPATDFHVLLGRSPRFREFCTRYLSSLLRDSRRLLQMHFSSNASEQQAMNRALRTLVTRPAVSCSPQTPLGTALRSMHQERVGSVIVVSDQGVLAGILTRHDVLDRVVLAQCDLAQPIAKVMTPDPVALSADASAYEAVLAMARYGIRHIPVLDGEQLIGVVTERDLFALQRVSMRQINRTITSAASPRELQQAAGDIRRLAKNLLAHGVAAEQLTLIISTLNDTLTQRIIELEQSRHSLQDIDWCWRAFGSEGRLEQTISTDQDNGLIFTVGHGVTQGQARERLSSFAQAVNRMLDACGFPLCSGNIMAGNPQWCLSLHEWEARFASWTADPDPRALLNAVIFFDFRALSGSAGLADALREKLFKLTTGNARFLRQLAEYALEARPPLGLLRDFLTDEEGEHAGTLDLKKSGARLFVDAARIFSLATASAHTSTAQRLRQGGARLNMGDEEIAAAVEAFYFIQLLRLRGQITAEPGQARATHNRIDPYRLNEVDRRILKESLRQARKLQSRLALDYQL